MCFQLPLQLLGQLHRTAQELEDLVRHDENASKILEINEFHDASQQISSAASWKLCDCRPWDNRFSLASVLLSWADLDEDLITVGLPSWALEASEKFALWQKSLLHGA